MVSRLESTYNDLLSKLSPELKERVNERKIAHRDFLEIARSVIVKEEEDGSISISKSVLTEKDVRKAEISHAQIELIRRICSAADEKIVHNEKDKTEEIQRESPAVLANSGSHISILRRKDKRKEDNELDCGPVDTSKELKQKKVLTKAERAQIAEEVKDIFLENSRLPDAILVEIAEYIEETSIVLTDFAFEKKIPKYLGNIVSLDLSKEPINFESFCEILDKCKNLQSLTLQEAVDDIWLEEIAKKLPHLKSLSFGGTSITDIGFEHIATLSFLEKLVVSECERITDKGIDIVIQKLENLQKLDISMKLGFSGSKRITGKAFENIGKRNETLISLKLRWFDNLTKDDLNKIILDLDNLQELTLSSGDYSDESLVNIGKFSNSLQELDLTGKFSGKFLANINQNFEALKRYSLQFYPGFEEPYFLHNSGKFPALESLRLSFIESIACKGIESIIHGARQLKSIDLGGCISIDDEVLKLIASECPNLKTLKIIQSKKVTNVGIDSIAKCCLDIEELDMQNCSEVDDQGLKSIGENFHKLRILNLHGCTKVTDDGINSISLGCPNLININITNCSEVTDLGIQSLSKGIKNLQNFEIGNCKKVTSLVFDCLSEWCDSLQSLTIGDCKINEELFSNFTNDFPVLSKMVLYGCKNLNDITLSKIPQVFPSLQTLKILGSEEVTNDGIKHLKSLQKLSELTLSECRKITDGVMEHILGIPNILSIAIRNCGVSNAFLKRI